MTDVDGPADLPGGEHTVGSQRARCRGAAADDVDVHVLERRLRAQADLRVAVEGPVPRVDAEREHRLVAVESRAADRADPQATDADFVLAGLHAGRVWDG